MDRKQDGRQKTEDRGHRVQNRRQGTVDRRQKLKNREQRTEKENRLQVIG